MTNNLLRTGRILAATLAVIAIACAVRAQGAFRSESAYTTFDCKADIERYAEVVASLNGAPSASKDRFYSKRNAPVGDAEPLTGVLIKTDGKALVPEAKGLRYCVAGPRSCYTLYYASMEAAERAVAAHRGRQGIVYAELDSQVSAASTDTDAFRSWGAAAMGFARYLDYCDRWGEGSATIAIIDSGVSPHPMLMDRMAESGYDYIDGDNDATNDLFGHGTHVAGIAADCTRGTRVSLVPIRVLDEGGMGKTSNVINAVGEACSRGVDVINLSMASPLLSEALDTAIREAVEENVIVVVAAGNGGRDTEYVSPAHLRDRGVVVVGGAEDKNGVPGRGAYSNFGESVDLYAYGTDIVCCALNGDFEACTGTSIAAPHVSGLCALMRLVHPGLSPAAAEDRLLAACVPGTEVGVPGLARMIPEGAGFCLNRIVLSAGMSLALPSLAEPVSAQETLTYGSGDAQTVAITDRGLVALNPGTTRVTATCTGLDAICFEVEVLPLQEDGKVVLPPSLTVLEDEAFLDDPGLRWVEVPEGVTEIGDRVFDGCVALETVRLPDSLTTIGTNTFSDAVLLCGPESAALDYAHEMSLQYIIER